MEIKITPINALGIGLGLVGIAYAYANDRKMRKAAETVNEAKKDISKLTHVEISEKVVDDAINEAVKKEAEKTAEACGKRVVSSTMEYIEKEVRQACKDKGEEITKSVSENIAIEAAKVDVDKIRNEAVKLAKQTIADKLDGKLDFIAEEFSQNLNNVGKIYSSFASKFTDTGKDGINLKIG